MIYLLPALGMLLIFVGMQDLFHTLFHPSEHGNISEYMTLRVWRTFRRWAPHHLHSAGPVNLLLVILFWAVSVVVGFALIYRPFLPSHFVFASGLHPATFDSFFSALNLSLSSLITVTLGVQTNSVWLQFAMSFEAVLGFSIFTASISWILSIYPVIEHRRSMAHEVTLLHFAEQNGIRRLEQMTTSDLQNLFEALAAQLITIRTELSQFPITYYFQERDDKSALAPALYYLASIAQDVTALGGERALSATLVGGAVDDLLELVEKKYLKREHPDRWSAFQSFLRDHNREPLRRPAAPAPLPRISGAR
jgi:hypothetical protein